MDLLLQRRKLLLMQMRRKEKNKKIWIKDIYKNRVSQGDFHNLVSELRLKDVDGFFNYFRMTPATFDFLLSIVGPSLEKKNTNFRRPISSAEKLSLTLRHLGHQFKYLPLQHGFHEWFGSANCHFGPYDKSPPNIPVFQNNEMVGRYYQDFKIDHNTGESNFTMLLISEAVKFINDAHKSEKPFFLYWTPDSSHAPCYASRKFLGKSRRGLYGDAVKELDYGVGKILDTLKSLNIDKNTFVFFTSDNGAALVSQTMAGSNGPFLCGKQTTFEGGMREPAIAWWPSVIPAGKVSHQTSTVMDLFATALDLAGIKPPQDRFIDGISLVNSLVKQNVTNRPIFYYRGNELMAVRYDLYKAHFWCWLNSYEEFHKGIDFCPGMDIKGVTTHDQMNYTAQPILYHLGRDPGEKYAINPSSKEYKNALEIILQEVQKHKNSMIVGKPQLNICDEAVMHWSPPGCEKLKDCLKPPSSKPYKCDWPH